MSNTLFKFELPTLFARAKTGAVLTWDIEVEGNKYRMITGQETGGKTESKWTIAEGKNVGQSNETTGEQQAEMEATSKWKKKLKSGGYFEDVKDIDKPLAFIEPMLAHPLYSKKTKKVNGKEQVVIEDRTPFIKLPVMVDRKYNGMRQVTSAVGPKSRKGEEVKSAPHIWEALESLFEKIPSLVLDGELYNHDYRHKLNELIHIVRTNADHKITRELLAESERIVRYYVYDGYGFDCPEKIAVMDGGFAIMGMAAGTPVTEDTPCALRREALKALLKGVPYIVVVPYYISKTMEDAKVLYGDFIEDGYEGAILRNANAPYQHFRTNDLIKLKPFEDMEVIILAIIDPGSGNWGGTGKTAMVRMDNGKEFKATFKGSRETAIKILKEQDKWVGQKVTMTYNGWTGKGPNFGQIDPNNCAVGDR
jgi:ATP-dependent DNA ligase